EHARMGGKDAIPFDAETAGDDDAPVVGHGLADGIEAFRLGRIEKAAGIDHHHVGAGVVGRQLVTLGPQPRDDALAVDHRLRAAERNERDAGRRPLAGLRLAPGLPAGALGAGGAGSLFGSWWHGAGLLRPLALEANPSFSAAPAGHHP